VNATAGCEEADHSLEERDRCFLCIGKQRLLRERLGVGGIAGFVRAGSRLHVLFIPDLFGPRCGISRKACGVSCVMRNGNGLTSIPAEPGPESETQAFHLFALMLSASWLFQPPGPTTRPRIQRCKKRNLQSDPDS